MGEYLSKLNELYQSNISKPGIVRITELLKRLGNPQNDLKCVHVAGTNGKGSTCAYIEAILRCAGNKTALFSSPHIYDIREYIKIDNEMISELQLEEYAETVFEVCEKMVDDGFEHPTYFEVMTAVAFDFFNDIEVDVAVIETGMGGKSDATNVIYPILSVITPISLDHVGFLGNTLSKIAEEKAGIIKGGIPTVVSHNQPAAAYRAIKTICKKANSEIIDAGRYDIDIYDISLENMKFTARYDKKEYRFTTKNIGLHQAENAVSALCAAKVLAEEYDINYSDIKKGINTAAIDSRIQLYKDKEIIIDVSHNPAGVCELGAVVKELLPERKIVLLCSILQTKDVGAMVKEYKEFVDYAIITESSHPMAAKAEELAKAFKKQSIECEHSNEIDAAVKKAQDKCAQENAYLIVSGSFYSISDIKKAFKMI